MNADIREFGKRSFQIMQKVEKLIFVTAHKTTRSHLEVLPAKNLRSTINSNHIALQHL